MMKNNDGDNTLDGSGRHSQAGGRDVEAGDKGGGTGGRGGNKGEGGRKADAHTGCHSHKPTTSHNPFGCPQD